MTEFLIKLVLRLAIYLFRKKKQPSFAINKNTSSEEILRIAHKIESRDELMIFIDQVLDWKTLFHLEEDYRNALVAIMVASQLSLEKEFRVRRDEGQVEVQFIQEMAKRRDSRWIPHVSSLSSILYPGERVFFLVSESNQERLKKLAELHLNPWSSYPNPDSEEVKERMKEVAAGKLPEPFFLEPKSESASSHSSLHRP